MKIDLVKYPVLTTKSNFLKKKNCQYTFDVNLKLNKSQIKNLIQELFTVKIISINTHCPPRKKKVLGTSRGYRPGYKRVIITLKSNNFVAPWEKETVGETKLNT